MQDFKFSKSLLAQSRQAPCCSTTFFRVTTNYWQGSSRIIYPLDGRNTKKSKAKAADFFVNTGISVNIFQKNPKITIILGFSFMYPFGFS